jgi:hypothetical protein
MAAWFYLASADTGPNGVSGIDFIFVPILLWGICEFVGHAIDGGGQQDRVIVNSTATKNTQFVNADIMPSNFDVQHGVIVNSIGMKMALIPAGEFQIGSPQAEIENLVETTKHAGIHELYRIDGIDPNVASFMRPVTNLLPFLRRIAKKLTYEVLLRPLPRPFTHVRGNCWSCQLPQLSGLGDDDNHSERSTMLLFENERYLGPPHSQQNYVKSIGRGWYRHWKDSVYFSTSDNSDPNANGRKYSYSTSEWLYNRRSGAPVNLRSLRSSFEAVRSDVEYALAGSKYVDAAHKVGVDSFAGIPVLELGPGFNCSWAILLASHGARPIVADPYPARWNQLYHPRFFELLRDRIAVEPGCSVEPINRLLKAGDFVPDVIERHDCPVEQLDLEDEAVECVFSNAVVEHFYDVEAAFRQLFRVTQRGGYGFHWVDFRDHRDFDRPLEYLLMPESEFKIEFGLHRGELGHQMRPHELQRLVESVGFDVVSFEPTLIADESYLAQFIPRLRACSESSYRSNSVEQFQVISGFFCLKRPSV